MAVANRRAGRDVKPIKAVEPLQVDVCKLGDQSPEHRLSLLVVSAN